VLSGLTIKTAHAEKCSTSPMPSQARPMSDGKLLDSWKDTGGRQSAGARSVYGGAFTVMTMVRWAVRLPAVAVTVAVVVPKHLPAGSRWYLDLSWG